MNIIHKLTLRHLRQNRNRTLITMMGIMLSVAMVCAVSGFVMSLHDMMIRTLIDSGKDYHIAYFGVKPETAEQIAAEPVFSTHYTTPENDGQLVTLYVRFENADRDYWTIASAIGEKHGIKSMSANAELLALEGVIAPNHVMMTFIWIATIAIIVIVAGSIIVIANAFYISSAERVRQFGLLKSVGATKSQISRSILFESFTLAGIAIPLGIALGFLVQAIVLLVTNDLLREISALNNGVMNFRVVFSPVIIYISVTIAAVTLLISAWLPARRAANTSPIDAIRQTKDIRIRNHQFKTSPLIGMLFGFEGTLAAKSLKRNRGKYRATVVSLTVSIVLFISMSSLVSAMNKGVEMEYGGYDFDVVIGVEATWNETEQITEALRSLPDAQVSGHRRILLETTVPDGFITENALENMTTDNHYGILLHLIPDTAFTKIAGQSGTGVLVNTTGTFSRDGKRMEATPYLCEVGTELPLGIWNDKTEPEVYGSVTISTITSDIPAEIPAALFDGSLMNVLVAESDYKDMYQYSDAYTFYTIITADSEAFCTAAEKLIPKEGRTVMIQDVAQTTRMNRNIVNIIMLFGYGFIAMLSLIAVTSVISTISTGMALRKQEFAMLYSAGMTPGSMNKMLNLESLLYGFQSLAIGLPIGLGISLLIHKGMSETFVLAYEPPIAAMLISAAAVMLLTFGTMRYGKRKLNKISIIEALRSEVA